MTSVLDRNLAAAAAVHRDVATALRDAAPHPDIAWYEAAQPPLLSARITDTGSDGKTRRITLASRFKPLDEAQRFAESADLADHAAFVVMGFGLGYHVRELLRRVRGKGLVIVYEPDVSLLRAVVERVELADVLANPALVLLVGDPDESALTRRLEPHAPTITQGVQILTHAPTRQRHPEALTKFSERLTHLVAFCRTNVATALVNSGVTCRNLTCNLAHYAAGPTVRDLHNVAAGYPAVVVAAGPSLAKNVHLLAQPGMRDRVVIIAAQTVLKPLLARGIRPHFVTALDYHEISARFYEELPDLPDVTLVAEPKAHPTILDRYPGPVCILKNAFLDRLLGPEAREIPAMRAGSTVAHLSLYLAWHLGCDPVMLIGQDLGFSDGLYYCPGTAIHDVWAPELNAFNTLEMMEWKRVARHKSHLRRRPDIHGRSIYTDEQMLTYLAQFERDFAASPSRLIDATEGGLSKAHTERSTLKAALAEHATRPLPTLPSFERTLESQRLRIASELLQMRVAEVQELRDITEQTLPVLQRMLKDQRNAKKMNRHFDELNRLRKRAGKRSLAMSLVNEMNQVAVMKRLRADRSIRVDDDADPYERQARQLERDQQNLRWLIDGCDEALRIFQQGADRLESAQASAPELAVVEGRS